MDNNVFESILNLPQEEQAVLATVIATRGSTPRKAGAQILFFRDGRTAGTIGGGCGEAEARRHAWQTLQTGKPVLVQIDLTHEVAEEDGMVCGGTMEIFLEPLGCEN